MPPLDHAEYLARRGFLLLDGLRALSILAVVWYHVPRQAPLPGALERGFLGVDLFFVLSGFLITTLLLRERDRRGRIDLPAFYARRTLRIFPAYYLVLGLYTAWIAWSTKARELHLVEPFFASLPYYATYTANVVPTELSFRHTWSLATEEQFYLLWPPLLAWLGPRRAAWLLAAVFAVAQALNFGWLDGLYAAGFRPNPAFAGTTFAPIALGVALAFLLHAPRGHELVARWLGAPRLGWPLLLLAVGAASLPEGPPVAVQGLFGAELVHFRGVGRLATHLAMAALLAHCVVQERTALRGCLTAWPLAFVGRISYGMYLLHVPLFLGWYAGLYAAFGLPAPQLATGAALLFFCCAALLTILLASLSFFLFEQPLLRWKRRFER